MPSILPSVRALFKNEPNSEAWALYVTCCSDLGRLPSDDELEAWLFAQENGFYPDDETPTVDYALEYEPDPEDADWWAEQRHLD